MRWRSVVPTAVLAVVAVSLSSCSGLATNTQVQPGLDVDSVVQPALQYVPPAPRPGGTEEEVLRGFLRAGTASDGIYDVARSFLTPTAAKAWVPDGVAIIYAHDRPLVVTPLGHGVLRLTVTEVARIETGGRYLPTPPGQQVSVQMTMTKVGSQWRISSLPKDFGRWVGTQDVDRLFGSYRLMYLSTTTGEAVPDVRWFPQDHLPTRLAKALLDPMPRYLLGAVRTALPPDASLESVPSNGGVATVDLTGSFSNDTNVRRAVWMQFVLTLAQLPDVNQVVVQSDGALLDYTNKPTGALTPADVVPRSPAAGAPVAPILRVGSKVTSVDPRALLDGAIDGKANVRPRRVYADVPPGWIWLALAPHGSEVVGVDGGRGAISRWRGVNRYDVPVAATKIGRPSYDGRDALWFGGQGTKGGAAVSLWAVNANLDPADPKTSPAFPVQVPWLTGRVVLSAKVSADNQRVAVVSTDTVGNHPRVDVAGVTRDATGMPTSLADPLPLAPTMTLATDVVWLDDSGVAVLGRVANGEPVRPYIISLGGRLSALASIPGAVAITSLGTQRDVVVTTDAGTIQLRAGVRWVQLAKGTDFAVAPG